MKNIIVLMSTYNGEKYIKKQIESILEQSGCHVELFVRDDGSTDNTTYILEEYRVQNKLNWYTGKNIGTAKSFYELLLNAPESDYYAFADQDDIWFTDKLCSAIDKLADYDDEFGLYYGNAQIADERGNSIGINTYKITQKTNFYGFVCSGGALGCTMVINKKLREIAKSIGMPQNIKMHDDYLTSLCFSVDGKVIYDHDTHMLYRQHNNNVMGIPRNFIEAVKYRFETFIIPVKISIADQAQDILEHLDGHIPQKYVTFLQHVAKYRKSITSRLYIAFHLKTKYVSIKSAIFIRFGLLIGKR